jgi:uncharacterized protein YbaA (DUF1428 family)
MSYVDAFLLPVKKSRLAEYKKMAQIGAKVWKKHGALQYVECVGEDMHSPMTKYPFPRTLKLKPDEVVVISWIAFKSKAHRNAVNKKVMADPAMNNPKYNEKNMPFDMKRMAYGGFKPLVHA